MSVKFVRSWGWAVCAISVAVIGLGCPPLTTTVPDLVGLEEDAALAALEEIGLIADVYRIHDDVVAEDIVLSQDPAADAEVDSGTTVTLGVSLGPCFVPDVIYDTIEDATAAIVAADLIVGETEERFDATAPAGTVLETEPVAGTQIAVGSAVNLVVSKGPDPMVGLINVPTYPAPFELAVDGLPMSQNADTTAGAWHWFKFDGTAGAKYYVHVTGNAPVNAMVFIERSVPGTEQLAADMLWTTDADLTTYWEFIYDEICQDCEDDCATNPNECECSDCTKVAKSEKSIIIPNFVAPEDGTYYVVVQAAKILTCFPECTASDYLMAAYYDIRTFSVQVTTNTSYEDAIPIQAFDPTTDAPFYRGVVKVNKHDWLSFNAEAASNYMIEFMKTDLSFEYGVKATLYGPLGDVVLVCTAGAPAMTDCDNCGDPEALFAPNAGTYYILIEVGDGPSGSGPYDEPDDLEFGEFPYIFRVLDDDHGNAASLATTMGTPALGAEEVADGYLSRGDVDWFNFVPGRFATYRVETRGEFNLALTDGFAYSFANYDGKNDMAIIVNTNSTALQDFGVNMPDFVNDPYWLQQGAYQVALVGDDIVDPDIRNIAGAVDIAIGGTGTGIVWPMDQDLFSFDLAYNYMHKIVSTGAAGLEVKKVTADESALQDLTVVSSTAGIEELKTITVYVNPYNQTPKITEDIKGYIVAKGATSVTDPAQLNAAYQISVERGENPIFTGAVDPSAQSVAIGGCLEGSLWPAENNVVKFTATKAWQWYKLTLTGADTLAAYVDANDDGLLSDPAEKLTLIAGAAGRSYLQLATVATGGSDVYLVISNTTGEAEYEICVAEDDHRNNSMDEVQDEAAAAVLTTTGLTGVAWFEPLDVDSFKFDAIAQLMYKVRLTATVTPTDVITLWAEGAVVSGDLDPAADKWEQEARVPADVARTLLARVTNTGAADVTYTIKLEVDDVSNERLTAKALTVGTSTAGVAWETDKDCFAFTPIAAHTYRITLTPTAPANPTFVVAPLVDINPDPAIFEVLAPDASPVYVDVNAGATPGAYTILVTDVT
ncbi:MAG TPA: PASTA domain-containing protein [Candidatus Hydrogenedentes bacterium]|nr:PASTA domain-containing protein [Candidatus Hydrogenedentota bacterium]HQH53453.1 PASTA domain-containing protein [Candidatus Hydrogenedentota bacterium]